MARGYMLADIPEGIREWILRHFPERQIYLRSGGEVKYYHLSTRLQVIISALLAAMALWCLYTMINLFLGHNPLRPANQELKRVQSHYQRLLADAEAKEANARLLLDEQRENFEQMAKSIEERHATLSQIMGTSAAPLSSPLKGLEDDTLTYTSNRVLMSPAVRDTTPRQSRKVVTQTAELNTGLDIDRSLNSLGETQGAFLTSAEDKTLDQIETNRALIRAVDMNVDTILQESDFGKGGPYIPVNGSDISTNDNGFISRVTSIQARLAEADALNKAVESMPLGYPIGVETYTTSGFGMRKDPFTKRPTFHEGLDFGGKKATPIVATAPGVVTFVGRNGGYGRVVEIDHGHGFMTRYAHLHKTYVKRGQTVQIGDEIGGMGSTGRSTANHLHYEVHFQGRVYDPRKFLKAGLYVQ